MKIPHSQPFFDIDDKNSILKVIDSKFVTSGDLTTEFGKKCSAFLGRSWGVPTQSGTDALTTALKVLKLKPGEKVLVPGYVCSAPLDALSICGLVPRPVDIDLNTMAIDAEIINSLPGESAVIGGHLFGINGNLDKIRSSKLIEDCAQTLPYSKFINNVGKSGRFTICSFYGTKLLTTGHGGMITGDEDDDLKSVYTLFTHDKQEKWEAHLHYLMSDLNSALGLSQLEKLDLFIEKRLDIAGKYRNALGDDKLLSDCIYSRFLVAVEGSIDHFLELFNSAGIEAKRPVYKPLYMYLGLDDAEFPNSKWVHDHIISIPIYPGMDDVSIEVIVNFLESNKNDLRSWPSA